MKRIHIILALTALAGIVSSQAWAGPTGRLIAVIVGDDQISSRPAAMVGRFARDTLSTVQGVIIIDPELALGEYQVHEQRSGCMRAGELLSKGKVLFEGMELDDAINQFEAALDRFLKCPVYIGNGAGYLESLTYLGAALMIKSRGSDRRGMELFEKAALFSPSSTISDQFPPDIQSQYESAKKRVASLPKGSIKVSASPAGAEITVDGVFAGVTPKTIEGLTTGEHFVAISKYGYETFGARIDIPPKAEVVFRDTMTKTRLFDEYSHLESLVPGEVLSAAAGGAVKGLSRLTGARLVLIGSVRREADGLHVVLSLFDADSGTRLSTDSKVMDPDGSQFATEVGDATRGLFGIYRMVSVKIQDLNPACSKDSDCAAGKSCLSGACAVPTAQAGSAKSPDIGSNKKFWQTWWFWTIVGGVVVAGGATVAGVLLSQHSGEPGAQVGFKF